MLNELQDGAILIFENTDLTSNTDNARVYTDSIYNTIEVLKKNDNKNIFTERGDIFNCMSIWCKKAQLFITTLRV